MEFSTISLIVTLGRRASAAACESVPTRRPGAVAAARDHVIVTYATGMPTTRSNVTATAARAHAADRGCF